MTDVLTALLIGGAAAYVGATAMGPRPAAPRRPHSEHVHVIKGYRTGIGRSLNTISHPNRGLATPYVVAVHDTFAPGRRRNLLTDSGRPSAPPLRHPGIGMLLKGHKHTSAASTSTTCKSC